MTREARPETTAAKRQRERSDRRSTTSTRVTGGRRHLPVVETPRPRATTHLVPVRGERRLCRHEEACLDGHIAARPHGDPPASCPVPCRWWKAPESRVADHLYRVGAGALAHADQYRERWADEPRVRRGR